MLSKVEIENFQSHETTVVELAPGTNVIIGDSDAGKSAINRAISWVISNRPLGDGFRSEWGGDTRVVLYTEEGNVVERIRTASRNEYIINGETVKAFGSDVPEEVIEMLQIDAASIQSQGEKPFLLAETPGEAARQLNKAASIDDIDRSTSNLKSRYTKLDNDIKSNEKRLEQHEEEIKQYDDIPMLEKKLQRLEKLEKRKQQKRENLTKLKDLVSDIQSIKSELGRTEEVPALLEKLQTLQESYQALEKKKQKLTQLKHLTKCIIRIYDTLKSTDSKLKEMEKEFHRLSPKECPLCGNPMKKT